MQNRVAHRLRHVSPRRVEIELELPGERRQHHFPEVALRLTPRDDHALEQRDSRISQDQLFADATSCPQATAGGARAKGRVERKVARLQLRQRDATHRAAISLREELDFLRVDVGDFDESFGQLDRGFDGIHESRTVLRTDHEAVDDNRDRVVLPAVQLRRFGDFRELAIHVCANEALLPNRLEELAELALSPLHQRCTKFDACIGLPAEHDLRDLGRALPLDRTSAVRTVRSSSSREEEASQ